jgi:hypothetical protein
MELDILFPENVIVDKIKTIQYREVERLRISLPLRMNTSTV